jgi:CheY-like chemotaxis protein
MSNCVRFNGFPGSKLSLKINAGVPKEIPFRVRARQCRRRPGRFKEHQQAAEARVHRSNETREGKLWSGVMQMTKRKVLLVDDNEDDRLLTRRSLEKKDCEVVSASTVVEALRQIATQNFDVLITDLHMPDAGDGFAVVTAMRHTQPNALTLVASDFPDTKRAMDAILLQADEILVKPFSAEQLDALLDKRKSTVKLLSQPKESVANILDRDIAILIERWLERVERVKELAGIPLTAKQRTAYLPEIVKNLSTRLRGVRDIEALDSPSTAAVKHGQLRFRQGYTPPLIVQESRILQVSIFETIERNLSTVDFNLVLPDIMIIADEVDSQLKQAIDSFLMMQQEGDPVAPTPFTSSASAAT